MITQEQLDGWRKLTDAATPGSWEVADGDTRICAEGKRFGKFYDQYDGKWPENAIADAAFIASAREAVPALLDEVARLAGRVDHLTRQRELDAVASRQQGEYAAELHARLKAAEAWATKRGGQWMVALLVARAEVARLTAENERLSAIVAQAGAA